MVVLAAGVDAAFANDGVGETVISNNDDGGGGGNRRLDGGHDNYNDNDWFVPFDYESDGRILFFFVWMEILMTAAFVGLAVWYRIDMKRTLSNHNNATTTAAAKSIFRWVSVMIVLNAAGRVVRLLEFYVYLRVVPDRGFPKCFGALRVLALGTVVTSVSRAVCRCVALRLSHGWGTAPENPPPRRHAATAAEYPPRITSSPSSSSSSSILTWTLVLGTTYITLSAARIMIPIASSKKQMFTPSHHTFLTQEEVVALSLLLVIVDYIFFAAFMIGWYQTARYLDRSSSTSSSSAGINRQIIKHKRLRGLAVFFAATSATIFIVFTIQRLCGRDRYLWYKGMGFSLSNMVRSMFVEFNELVAFFGLTVLWMPSSNVMDSEEYANQLMSELDGGNGLGNDLELTDASPLVVQVANSNSGSDAGEQQGDAGTGNNDHTTTNGSDGDDHVSNNDAGPGEYQNLTIT